MSSAPVFTQKIIRWYNASKRDLPWRKTADPYRIWLSEVILQQTRVSQGTPYYIRFTEKFPDVFKLARASEDEVMKLWQGLGYYSRARNMHATARIIAKEYNGLFPRTKDGLLKLKGIGEYTAGAIASIAFNEACPVVDGNVFRVLSRYFGIDTPIDSHAAKKEFYELSAKLLDRRSPGTYNQAVMEFGALHCTPKQPACNTCPLQSSCKAYAMNAADRLPVKAKAVKPVRRYLHYIVVTSGNQLLINQRMGNDIWRNLYDFPCVESDRPMTAKQLQETKLWKNLLQHSRPGRITSSKPFMHQLSHQTLYATFTKAELPAFPPMQVKGPLKKVRLAELSTKYAIPRLIEKYLFARKVSE